MTTMQSFVSVLIAALAVRVAATPVSFAAQPTIYTRQDSTTENEFYSGGCRNVILFFARGTDQSGNIVRLFLV